MGLAIRLARKSLIQRLGRTIFSVLGIGLGIATVVGVFTLDHNTVAGLKVRADEDWNPDIEVRPHAELEDPSQELEETHGVATSAAFFQNEVSVRKQREGGTSKPLRAKLYAVEAEALPEMNAYRLLVGEHLEAPSTKPQVLVGKKLAQTLGLELGDTLYLSRPKRAARAECINGVMRRVDPASTVEPPLTAFEVSGVLAHKQLGRQSGGAVVIVDYDWGTRVFAGARIDTRYWVRPDDAFDLEGLQTRLATNFAYDIGRSVVVGQAADEKAFRNGVRMAGLLALVLGLYVIFHTLSMSLIERIREVGTLHALGTTRGQITRIFLVEAVWLAALGGLAGLSGGVLLAWGLLEAGISTLGTGHYIPGFSVPWDVALPLTGLGMGIALLGSIFPLFRARHASTVEVLRGEKALSNTEHHRGFHLFSAILLAGLLPALYLTIVPVLGDASKPLVTAILLAVGILSLLVILPLLVPSVVTIVTRALAKPLQRLHPFSGRMAASNMFADPRRVAISTAAIALVTAGFVGLKGMTASLRAETEVWAEEAMGDKVYVRNLAGASFEQLRAKLKEYPGVVGVENGSLRHYAPFLILGQPGGELARYGPLARDPVLRAEFEERHGIILSKRVSRNLSYELGDSVRVGTGGGRIQEFRVIAITDEYGYFPKPDERLYGIVDERYMKRYFCLDLDKTDMLAVQTEGGADRGTVLAAVHDALEGEGEPEVLVGKELVSVYLWDIATDFFLFDIILFLTALLAGLGVLNGQLLSALERSKEIGVLKALGASRRQVARMVRIESGLIGLLGGVLGYALGSLMGPVIVELLESLSGLILPPRGAGLWGPMAVGSATVLALLAGAYPIWWMNRTDPVRAVRTG